MKLGAFDYLQKPFPLKNLEVIARKAAERRKLKKEVTQPKQSSTAPSRVGNDRPIAGHAGNIPPDRTRWT